MSRSFITSCESCASGKRYSKHDQSLNTITVLSMNEEERSLLLPTTDALSVDVLMYYHIRYFTKCTIHVFPGVFYKKIQTLAFKVKIIRKVFN